MGLFSTLATGGVETASSSRIPTVVQLYAAPSEPIRLDSTPTVSGFTSMTYQAVQVTSLLSDDEQQQQQQQQQQKNKHYKPDLGVWNCLVQKQPNPASSTAAAAAVESTDEAGPPPPPLVDQLLRKVVSSKNIFTYVFTVDLSDETQVEPAISLLQGALIRHLIENPPTTTSAGESTEEASAPRKTATTSLHKLKTIQFGLAPEDPKRKNASSTNESDEQTDKSIKTALMICAVFPPSSNDVQAEMAYRTKQARALVLYHLRKYAAALDASLCFVAPETPSSKDANNTSTDGAAEAATGSSEQSPQEQPVITNAKLAQLWRDLAQDKEVWVDESPTTAMVATDGEEMEGDEMAAPSEADATALYGPGRHQEDLIESVLLRNANFPGHWDASKESLWIALPTESEPPTPEAPSSIGDEGWLSQLRESIPTSEPVNDAASPEKKSTEEKPKEKDVAVSSFFENLLKK